jgi:hypothetical protein
MMVRGYCHGVSESLVAASHVFRPDGNLEGLLDLRDAGRKLRAESYLFVDLWGLRHTT